MADLARIERALRAAHAAGDTAAARRLAQHYKSVRGAVQPAPQGRSRGASMTISDVARGVDAGVRNAADGITLGYAPRIAAGADAIAGEVGEALGLMPEKDFSQRYNDNRREENARDDANRDEFGAVYEGLTKNGGAVAGALATPLARGVAAAPTMVGRLGRMMGVGAGVGAVEGSSAEGPLSERLKQAGVGAGIGAVAAPAAAAIPGAVGMGVQAVRRGIQNGRLARQLGTSREAAGFLRNNARSVDAADIIGDDAMLGDASGFRGILDTAVQSGSPAAATARDAIGARVEASARRLTGVADDIGGPAQSMRARQADIARSTAAGRRAAYDKAYDSPIDYASDAGRRVEDLLNSGRIPDEAINRANRLMRAEGFGSRQIKASIADDGSISFESMPDVRQVDFIKRAIDDMAGDPNVSGGLRGAESRAYRGLSRDLRETVDEAVPEYAAARAAGQDSIARQEAVEIGRDALRKTVRPDDLAERMRIMDPAQRAEMARGFRGELDRLMSDARRAVSSPDPQVVDELAKGFRDLSPRSARDKIALVLGDDAPRFFKEMDAAERALSLRADVARNSRTAPRQAAREAAADAAGANSAIGKARQGSPTGAVGSLATKLLGGDVATRNAMSDEFLGDLARVLTETRGTAARKAMRSLTRDERRVASRLVQNLTRGLPVGAGIAGAQQSQSLVEPF